MTTILFLKNELIDFGGQNETKYNRICFLELLQLTFEKTTENKREKLIRKNQAESKKSNYSFPVRRNSILGLHCHAIEN